MIEKVVLPIHKREQVDDLLQVKDGAKRYDILLGTKLLSRDFFLTLEEFHSFAFLLKEAGFCIILQWDIISTEDEFVKAIDAYRLLNSDLFDRVRVQDAGTLEFLFRNSKKPLELLPFSGAQNVRSLKEWKSYLGERLCKCILNPEISRESLAVFTKELGESVLLEILVLGPLLLFYSPRPLLSSLREFEVDKDLILGSATSEESPHKGFPIKENRHGVFMYHVKHLFLLDKIQEIIELGIKQVRIDLSQASFSLFKILDQFFRDQDFTLSRVQMIKEQYPHSCMRGYYQVNKSDVLFKKLKNEKLQPKDTENYLGVVLEVYKDKAIVLHLRGHQSLRMGDTLLIRTPQGKELELNVKKMTDSNRKDLGVAQLGDVVIVNYLKGVITASLVNLKK